MGVPCVTLRGGGHAHNVGVSLMRAVGLEEDWVAGTEEEYIDMAVRRTAWLSHLISLSRMLSQSISVSSHIPSPPPLPYSSLNHPVSSLNPHLFPTRSVTRPPIALRRYQSSVAPFGPA